MAWFLKRKFAIILIFVFHKLFKRPDLIGLIGPNPLSIIYPPRIGNKKMVMKQLAKADFTRFSKDQFFVKMN